MTLLAAGNNDWAQLLVPLVVGLVYMIGGILKNSDKKPAGRPPRPAPPTSPRPVPSAEAERPGDLMGNDPAAVPAEARGPNRPTPQQMELERLLRELGVPRPAPVPVPTPSQPQGGPARPGLPRRKQSPPKPTRKPAEPKKPSERAVGRHLESQLATRHVDRPHSRIENQHLQPHLDHGLSQRLGPATAGGASGDLGGPSFGAGNALTRSFMLAVVLGPPLALRGESGRTEPLL